MQTFLPYEDFRQTAQCLDDKRLGKQRVECLQILNALLKGNSGWSNHPAVKMWKGYEQRLLNYSVEICIEWRNRGFDDTVLDSLQELHEKYRNQFELSYLRPTWLGNPMFHLSHQSNLVRKYPEHYRKFFPDVPDDLSYFWPV